MNTESRIELFFLNHVPIVQSNDTHRRQHKYCDYFENYQVKIYN